jgi:hypothetical protein
LLSHEHVERAARRSRIHDFDTNTGAQELSAEGCGRKYLAWSGSQQNEFGIEGEDARRIEHDEVIHVPDVRHNDNRGRADDHGSAISVAVSIRADDMSGGTGVLSEAHMRKILNLTPERSSTHYFRFSRRSALDRQRAPLLERLLARADASTPVTNWRVDAFRLIAPAMTAMPGVAATALYAEAGTVTAASVFLATPVHYVAEMSNVRLPIDGILSLRQSEADALAVDFNRIWNDAGIRLIAGRSAHLFCLVDQTLEAATHDPEEVLDKHIENHLPTGGAAARLRRLMSEIEMWLFEHAVNRSRSAAALPEVKGLWLWGGGPALTSLPPVQGWTAGDDPFFNVFAARPASSRGEVSGVLVTAAVPGTAEWRDLESSCLERSLADLHSGRIVRLHLSAGDRCFSVGARWRWRLWRRHRPWWESFA